jgi:hypothetical protein
LNINSRQFEFKFDNTFIKRLTLNCTRLMMYEWVAVFSSGHPDDKYENRLSYNKMQDFLQRDLADSNIVRDK